MFQTRLSSTRQTGRSSAIYHVRLLRKCACRQPLPAREYRSVEKQTARCQMQQVRGPRRQARKPHNLDMYRPVQSRMAQQCISRQRRRTMHCGRRRLKREMHSLSCGGKQKSLDGHLSQMCKMLQEEKAHAVRTPEFEDAVRSHTWP